MNEHRQASLPGMLMQSESGNPHEVEGVFNPPTVRDREGELYLFPRLVAEVSGDEVFKIEQPEPPG
jgi:hypothetical protein